MRTELLDKLAGLLYFSSIIPLVPSLFPTVSSEFGLLLLTFFLVYSYFAMKRGKSIMGKQNASSGKDTKIKTAITIATGALGVIIAASFLVDSSSAVAELLGLSKLVVGASGLAGNIRA